MDDDLSLFKRERAMVLSFKSVHKGTTVIRAPELVQGRQPSKKRRIQIIVVIGFS